MIYTSTRFIFQFCCLLACFCMIGCERQKVSTTKPVEEATTDPLFSLLPSQKTNVQFENKLVEGLNTNILMYEYFYNGGGVSSGDLNGDGLIDLYFVSNMGSNQLYLNEGKMSFRDVTGVSKVSGRPGPWKTGVTFVDINGDRKLDIYLCYSGTLPDPKRTNQLFVNQGNDNNGVPVFKEMAKEYGLASTAFSNQAYFFDADLDGDLDALLLNHNPKSLPVLNETKAAEFIQKDDPQKGVRFYRQQNQVFLDATVAAGVSGSALTYGLGIGISDVNNDGWPDFYISNDYTVPDYLYINNQDGTFTNQLNQSMGHNSHFSMGNDIADINNDGLNDIVTLDMLPEDNHRQKLLLSPDNYAKFDLNVRSGFHYQYMRNMLQLNNGNGTFSEIGQMAGISNTDWSWAALLADYDNDGWKDLFVTNGYLRDYTNLDFIKYMDDYVKSRGRLVREEVLDIISHMPASEVTNYVFSNRNGISFQNETSAWGIGIPSNSNGATYADLDNDGDLDLVVNNINQQAFVFQNKSEKDTTRNFLQVTLLGAEGNTQGIGAKVMAISNGKRMVLEQYLTRGYLSSVSPVLNFGLGRETIVDSLIVTWPGGKGQVLTKVKANQRLDLKESDAVKLQSSNTTPQAMLSQVATPINFGHAESEVSDFDRQPLLIHEFSHSGPCMAKADVNGDGLEDVFVGGAKGQSASLFIQTGRQKFNERNVPDFDIDKESDDVSAIFFDANQDGHQDLYIASGGYHDFKPDDPRLQDRLYINDGKGNFRRDKAAIPSVLGSKGVVVSGDANNDGYPDLFVGGKVVPGQYPVIPESYLLVNDGSGRFEDKTSEIAPGLKRIGMVTDASWVDINADQMVDLVVVGEWMPVTIMVNSGGTLANKTSDYLGQQYSGWWNTLEVTDLNGDQQPDLIVGNMGSNTQFSVSDKQPAEMFYSDFDNNGSIDPVFCFYIQGKSYPYVTRDELLSQLSGMRSRYTSYESYAGVGITDIFDQSTLSEAGKLTTNHLQTSLFLSSPNGQYARASLPAETQYSPVYSIVISDFNEDGAKDLLLCGNSSRFKLRLGKFDANYGVLLRGDGAGRFTYVDQTRSGLQLTGDVRSTLQIGNTLLFGINGQPVKSYQINQNPSNL